MGPLIDKAARVLAACHGPGPVGGGEIIYGGEVSRVRPGPAAVMSPLPGSRPKYFAIVREETFGPLLYLITYRDFEDAIRMQNAVPQGLSSGIFTNDMREAEEFISPLEAIAGSPM